MTPRLVSFSIRVYDRLLACYPPRYRQRFRAEMRQVFSQLICDRYREKGAPGILQLWLPLLADWAWTVAYQWICNQKDERRFLMSAALDQQLSDLVWSIATGLRAGYDLLQVFEVISKEAPEPASSAAKSFLDAIASGADKKTALTRLKQAFPSPFLDRLIAVILDQQQTGGNLADALEPLSTEFLGECGSDPAFYEFMRETASQLGARVPERARPQE